MRQSLDDNDLPAEEVLLRARASLDSGNTELSLELYARALHASPIPDTVTDIASALLEADKPQEAITLLAPFFDLPGLPADTLLRLLNAAIGLGAEATATHLGSLLEGSDTPGVDDAAFRLGALVGAEPPSDSEATANGSRKRRVFLLSMVGGLVAVAFALGIIASTSAGKHQSSAQATIAQHHRPIAPVPVMQKTPATRFCAAFVDFWDNVAASGTNDPSRARLMAGSLRTLLRDAPSAISHPVSAFVADTLPLYVAESVRSFSPNSAGSQVDEQRALQAILGQGGHPWISEMASWEVANCPVSILHELRNFPATSAQG